MLLSIKYINGRECVIYICFGRDYVNSTLQDASNKEVAGIAIVVLVLVVSPIIIILMRNAVATIQVCDSNAVDLIPFHATCLSFINNAHNNLYIECLIYTLIFIEDFLGRKLKINFLNYLFINYNLLN